MVAVVITLVVLFAAGIIVVALNSGRRRRVPVDVAVGARPVGPKRAFDEPAVLSATIVAPAPLAQASVPPPAAAAPLFDRDLEPEIVAPSLPEIRWASAFDKRSDGLDDTARLRLIGDLGVVATQWCVPLLCQAYEEEHRPANRQAALIALAACRSQAAVPTYRLALASGNAEEAAIAADALADLEPPALSKQRAVVERR